MSEITDWINATGAAAGAVATGGAFLVAAAVYRRQVADQRRAQAAAITVEVGAAYESPVPGMMCIVRNHSVLPIYEVLTWGSGDKRSFRPTRLVAPQKISQSALHGHKEGEKVHMSFTDSAGVRWTRSSSGALQEMRTGASPLPWLIKLFLHPTWKHLWGWRTRSSHEARSL